LFFADLDKAQVRVFEKDPVRVIVHQRIEQIALVKQCVLGPFLVGHVSKDDRDLAIQRTEHRTVEILVQGLEEKLGAHGFAGCQHTAHVCGQFGGDCQRTVEGVSDQFGRLLAGQLLQGGICRADDEIGSGRARGLLDQQKAVIHFIEQRPVKLFGAVPCGHVVNGDDHVALPVQHHWGRAEFHVVGFMQALPRGGQCHVAVKNRFALLGDVEDCVAQRAGFAGARMSTACNRQRLVCTGEKNAARFGATGQDLVTDQPLRPRIGIQHAGFTVHQHHGDRCRAEDAGDFFVREL